MPTFPPLQSKGHSAKAQPGDTAVPAALGGVHTEAPWGAGGGGGGQEGRCSHLLLSRSRHGEVRLQQNRHFSTEKEWVNINKESEATSD